MGFGNPRDQAETQAQTPLRARGIAPRHVIEPVENVWQVSRRDAAAGVFDHQFQGFLLTSQAHPHVATGRRELHGVRKQVGNHALDLDAIDFGPAFPGQIGGQPQPCFFIGDLKLIDDIRHQLAKVEMRFL